MAQSHHKSIDRARRAAKKAAREGGVTYQQALDAEARAAGHRHWSDMLSGGTITEMAAPPPTLASVEEEMKRLMSASANKPGMRISEWVSSIMRDAAAKASEYKPTRFSHGIRSLPVDVRMIAQAVDPMSGPWNEGVERAAVRCPLHDDANPSLVISGRGSAVRLACMAGCLPTELSEHAMSRIADAASRAMAFAAANDRSRVVYGASMGPEGVGGLGGFYRLADGKTFELDVLVCRMLPDGYPVWFDGALPRRVGALDRAIRILLAGRHAMTVEQPDERSPLWRISIDGGHRYRLVASVGEDGSYGVNAGFTGIGIDGAETYAQSRQAAARIHALLRKAETLDPDERRLNQERHDREVAHAEKVRGNDADGWGWWTGPNEDEFTWGGPWKIRAEAISQGNGHCSEEGETFYVIQARTEGEPDADGMQAFSATRGLKRCRAT